MTDHFKLASWPIVVVVVVASHELLLGCGSCDCACRFIDVTPLLPSPESSVNVAPSKSNKCAVTGRR